MPDITFTENAFAEYISWNQDKATMKRVNLLIRDILRSPFEGLGKPEPLRYGTAGRWSRRINDRDRIVYRVEEDTIVILQCKGHYEE